MYLEITNSGEVPVEAFTLVGASSKRENDGKIGMFGSGNKYALAYFMRNNYEVKIFSGKMDFKLELNKVAFGGRNIDVIAINGTQTSITTEMGPDWSLWQSIREFYSNAMDEGLLNFDIVEEMQIVEGVTSIYIKVDAAIEEFMENKAKYFCEKSTFVYKNKMGSILDKVGSEANVFRKGIRCFDESRISIFDYDFIDVEVNEDRLVKYTSKISSSIWDMILRCDNEVVITEFLEKISNRDYLEHNDYLNYWTSKEGKSEFSPAWDKVLKDKYVCPTDLGGYVEDEGIRSKTYFVPSKLHSELRVKYGSKISALRAEMNGNMMIRKLEANALELNTINKALEFFTEVRFPITDDIVVVDFIQETTSSEIMGMAKDGEILLSRKAFTKGVFYVATVIFEEHIHLKHKCRDETRQMQNCLIEEMLTYMKTNNGINL